MEYAEVIRRKNKILIVALFASILLRGIVNAAFMGIQTVIGLMAAGLLFTGILWLLAIKVKPSVMMYLMVCMLTGISIACMVAFPTTTNYLMFFLAIFMIVLYEDIRPIGLQCAASAACMILFFFRYREKLAETWSVDAMAMCIVYIASAMFVFWALCRLTGQQFAHLRRINAESVEAKEKAEHLLGKIKGSVKVLGDASGAIKSNIDEAGEISGQIAVGAEDVSARAMQEVNAVETICRMVERGVEKIQAVAEASRDMTALSNATGVNVTEGGGLVQDLSGKMRELNDKMDAIALSINGLNAENEKIIGILQTLDEITSQTNLLSLNASIEAARAGEHGRGFAVVATEIRNLSDASSKFTEQIHAILDGINVQTRQVKAEIEAGKEFVETCNRHTEQVDASFRNISHNTERVLTQAKTIETGAEELEFLMEKTRGNVQEINGNVEATSTAMEQITDSIRKLHFSVDRVVSEYHNIDGITTELVQAAEG